MALVSVIIACYLEDIGHMCMCVCVYLLSHVRFFVNPWIVSSQAPLSVGFSRQEHWRGLPFPSPGDLPDPGVEPASPALAGRFFTTVLTGKPIRHTHGIQYIVIRVYPIYPTVMVLSRIRKKCLLKVCLCIIN